MQLSGISHRGSRATDNTKGDAAIADLRRFAAAGITSLDTADTFGDSEAQIGRFLSLTPNAKDTTQIMTKVSFFGFNEVSGAASRQYVEQVVLCVYATTNCSVLLSHIAGSESEGALCATWR